MDPLSRRGPGVGLGATADVHIIFSGGSAARAREGTMDATTMTREMAFVPARASLGATMLYHGMQKLRGEGPHQTGEMLYQMGFRPGHLWARLTGYAEVFAGASAILGIATRLGALAVLVTQGVAVAKVHAPRGFSNMAGGYEFNAAISAIALGLLIAGPGRFSAHEIVERRIEGRARFGLLRPRRRAAARVSRLLR